MNKDFVKAHEILTTLSSPGWRHVDRLLENIVEGMERTALSVEDEQRIVAAQREARVARKVLEEFRSRVRIAGSVDPEPTADESILVAM